MRATIHQPSSERGLVMIPILFLAVALGGLAFALFQYGQSATRDVNQFQSSTIALELAESGIVCSEQEFRSRVDARDDGLGSVSATWRGGTSDVLSFDVTATPIGGGIYTLRSRGRHTHAVRTIEVGLKVTNPFVFRHALFARDLLILDSSFATDSWDNRTGAYSSQVHSDDSPGDYADATGHVGSNAGIEVRSSGIVRGDARCGPGFQTTLVGGSSAVTGSRDPMEEPFDVPIPPQADFEQAYLVNDNGRDIYQGTDITWDATKMNLTIDSNAVVRLTGGTYFFNQLKIDGSGMLQVDGPSTVYITGDFLVDSLGRINYSGTALGLKFIAHAYAVSPGHVDPVSPITFNSSIAGSFTLYAPGRDVELNSSLHIYGAIVGNGILATSSGQVHYDRALQDESGADSEVNTERLYWRELSPPRR